MNVNVSGIIDVISVIVRFIRDLTFTFGNYSFTLWEIILVAGTVDGIAYILGARSKGFKNNDDDGD